MIEIFDNKYKEELEQLLEKKRYSEEVKNLLLSMLYRIENAYKDYKKVKVNVIDESQFIEKFLCILKYECREIELIRKDEGKIKIDKEYEKMKTYANEKEILSCLYKLDEYKLDIEDVDKKLENKIKTFIEEAVSMDMSEILRDFNGWSWEINVKEIPKIEYNFIYQTLKILFEKTDIEIFRKYNVKLILKILKQKYKEEIIDNYINQIKEILLESKIKKEQIEQLHKYFLQAFKNKIELADNKEKTTKLVYEFRYFLMLPINKNKQAKDINKEEIEIIKKKLINKCFENKMFRKISADNEIQYEVAKEIFSLQMIDLEKVKIAIESKENRNIVSYYEDKFNEKQVEIVTNKKIKNKRKTRLFRI